MVLEYGQIVEDLAHKNLPITDLFARKRLAEDNYCKYR